MLLMSSRKLLADYLIRTAALRAFLPRLSGSQRP